MPRKLAKKAIRQHPEDGTNAVALGGVYQASGDAAAADKQWQKVLAQLTAGAGAAGGGRVWPARIARLDRAHLPAGPGAGQE